MALVLAGGSGCDHWRAASPVFGVVITMNKSARKSLFFIFVGGAICAVGLIGFILEVWAKVTSSHGGENVVG
jgi:hypothetical protein